MNFYRAKSNHWLWKELSRLMNHPYRVSEGYDTKIERMKKVLCRRRRNYESIWS